MMTTHLQNIVKQILLSVAVISLFTCFSVAGFGIFPPDDDTQTQLTAKEEERVKDSEDKCKFKSCCRPDDDDQTDFSECARLPYLKCLKSSNDCVWDCSNQRNNPRNLHFKRKFQGIDKHDAVFKMEHLDPEDKIRHSNFIDMHIGYSTVDDCGTMYKYSLTDESLHEEFDRISDTLNSDDASQQFDGMDSTQSPRQLLRRLATAGITEPGEMDESLRRKLGVIDPDARFPVTTWKSPYYKVGYLNYQTSDGYKRCSGALITRRHVLTAGHCVSDGEGNWFWNFKFYPSYNAGGTQVFGYSQAWTFTRWLDYKDRNYDIAILTLSTTDTGHGWFGWGWNTGITSSWQFKLAGYPADKEKIMQAQDATMDKLYYHILRSTTADVVGGNSGGPLYLDYYGPIYGVCSWGYWTEDSDGNIIAYTHNDMARITQGKYDSMCTYINGWIPDHC